MCRSNKHDDQTTSPQERNALLLKTLDIFPTIPMRLSVRLAAVAAIATFPTGLLTHSPSRLQAQSAPISARADSIFGRFAGPQSPGCAVDLRRGRDSLLTRAWGLAEMEHGIPITAGTIFEAGSVSKQFTAAAVLLLEQRGMLSLDDTLQRWFPEIPTYGTPITLRHLMQHTSGLRDWGAVAQLEGWPRGTRDHRQEHALTIASRQRALNHAPGAEFSYTNTGYNLLAMLVSRLSGMSFAEFTRTEFFEPLDMRSTSWRDDPARLVRGRAQAYAPNASGSFTLSMPFEHVHGNGGLLTTVGDLQRWTDALVAGKIGSPDVSKRMREEGRLTTGAPAGYGGGLFLDDVAGVRAVYHGGATAGYRAFLAYFPDTDLRLALLCNRADANPEGLSRRLLSDLLPFATPAAPAPSTPVTPARIAYDAKKFAEYSGVFVSEEANAEWTVTAGDAGLTFSRWPGDVAPLRATDTDVFAGPGGLQMRYTRDANGRVSGFTVSISRALGVVFTRR